jgi:hypothetical protein
LDCRFPKTKTRSAAILLDEIDAGRFERLANDLQRRPSRFASSGFELMNRDNPDPSRVGKILLAPRQETTRCSALGRIDHVSVNAGFVDLLQICKKFMDISDVLTYKHN